MCRISIVMPVYGVEKYIRDSVRSICQQTLQDFELILVNDDTRDKSIEVALNELQRLKTRFHYEVVNQKNSGVSVARNTGIKHARADWVICIDPDDCIHSRTIEFLDSCLNEYEKDYNLIWFDYQGVSIIPEKWPPKIIFPEIEVFSKEQILYSFLIRSVKLIVPAVLVQRSFLIEHDLWYDSECRFSEDVLAIWKYLYASNGIVFLKEKLYYYLTRPGSTMTSSGIQKIMTGYYAYQRYDYKLAAAHIDDGVSNFIFPRWVLGALHSAAKILDFDSFLKLAEEMDYKDKMVELKSINDFKTRCMAYLVRNNIGLFYRISQKV